MRLLVVEDEERLGNALEEGLQAEGFAVDLARNGLDGLWLATEHDYDAIVLDLLLPGMNGFEICRTLRAKGVWTPILVLTAKDGEYDEAEALDTGADDYLSKPFSFVVLVAHLRALLRRGVRERPAILVAGDLSLDPSAHRCSRGDTVIDLRPREFSLLEFLIRHPDEAVTKQQILRQVWGVDFEGDPNIVEVYVGYLRKKIDVPFGRQTIETVRGVGYRLRADGA
jgi:DNA-binding response OmpR family regulator